jgi:hypothetical protein
MRAQVDVMIFGNERLTQRPREMFIQPEYIRRCYTRRAIVVLGIRQRTARASEGKLITVSRTVSGFGAMSAVTAMEGS